jgi:glycosyltransferase involved in cell wall biosynthesis
MIKRVIACFKSQTYPNKELILVYEDKDKHIQRYARKIRDRRIRILEIPASPKSSLGELRNISIRSARGEYFCQWDADDWYHNRRLELQMDHIATMHKPVCMLTYWIMFDTITKKAFLSYKRIWEGTILCRKSLINDTVRYPSLRKKEDFYFVAELVKSNVVFPVDFPHLYIYVYHGGNTYQYQHFLKNFKAGIELPKKSSQIVHNILTGKYSNAVASRLLSSKSFLSGMEYAFEH